MILLGFAHREVARNQVKCLLFFSIFVKQKDDIQSYFASKKPGNSKALSYLIFEMNIDQFQFEFMVRRNTGLFFISLHEGLV